MPNLHKYPFTRLLLPLGMGIWIAVKGYFTDYDSLVWVLLATGLGMAIIARFFVHTYRYRFLFGLGMIVFLLAFGWLYTMQRTASNHKNHLLNSEDTYSHYFIRISAPPEQRENTLKFMAELLAVGDSTITKSLQANIMAYLQRSPAADSLGYGDLLRITKAPTEVEAPKNPQQFDYRRHLANKRIYHQVFLRDGEWNYEGIAYKNPLFATAYHMRDYLLESLRKNGLDGDEYAVASAILLGYDDHLPAYLRKGYVAAGAMHVLCVSGLHVGIIFIILNFLLGFLDKVKKGSTFKTILLLLAIWFYALLTGLSPSVSRASVMISFVLLAKLLNRKGNIINSVSASATLLLLINPHTLLHLGFQLSYTAVLGIVLFQKPIYDLFYIKNKILDKAWEVTALSFAAQLGTTPLAVHYFNQFPMYFWLSNLFLVPLSFAVIVAGMALLMLSFVPYVNTLLGLANSGLLYLLNLIIRWIEGLPLSTIQGLYLSPPEALLMYVFFGLLLIMAQQGIRKPVVPALLVLLFMFASFAYRTVENNSNRKFIVYSIPNQRIYDFVFGRDHILLADSSAMQNEFITGFNLKGNWIKSGLSLNPDHFGLDQQLTDHPYVYKNGMLMGFGEKRIAFWTGRNPCQSLTEEPYKIDLVIITGNTRENLEQLLNCYAFDLLVIDSSLPAFRRRSWTEALDKHEIEYHDVGIHGAFVWDMRGSGF